MRARDPLKAPRQTLLVQPDAGSQAVGYTLRATASESGAAAAAVSGAVLLTNSQPGFMPISQLLVTLSSGQTFTPTCSLTAPYVSSTNPNLVFGGINSGGSTTTLGGSVLGYYGGVTGVTTGLAGIPTASTFLLPQFASARCPFNITVQNPGATVQVTATVNFGVNGIYTLTNPAIQQVSLRPPTNFFPVAGCVSVVNQVNAGALLVSNDLSAPRQLCVTGTSAPFAQPDAFDYNVVATIGQGLADGCAAGTPKRYTIANTATATPVGGGGAPATAVADVVNLDVACPVAAGGATGGTTPTTGGTPPTGDATGSPTTNQQLQSLGPQLRATVGNFQTYVKSEYVWSVTQSPDEDVTLDFSVGDPRQTVNFTVTATRQEDPKDTGYFVSGVITVTNPGTVVAEATGVFVTAGAASVPATCDAARPGGLSLNPGDSLQCTFNVSWNRGPDPGFMGARVEAAEGGPFYASSAEFGFSNVKRSDPVGGTASLFVDATAALPDNSTIELRRGNSTPDWFEVADGAPPTTGGSPASTLEGSDTVTFTVGLGPFETPAARCGTYKISEVAKIVPSGGGTVAQATATITFGVTGCPQQAQLLEAASGDVTASVGDVRASVVTGTAWRAEGPVTPVPVTKLKYDSSKDVEFTVKFIKGTKNSYEVTGTVDVINGSPSDAKEVARVTVAVTPDGEAAAKTADAVCGDKSFPFTLNAGDTATCTFAAKLGGRAAGTVVATVLDGAGARSRGAPAAFSFDGAAERRDEGSRDCATASTGKIVGFSSWQPNRQLGYQRSDAQICDTKSVIVKATLGPFGPRQCGAFDAVHESTVAGASLFTPLPVEVTGCPDGGPVTPKVTVGSPKVELLTRHEWRVTLSHSAANPLVVKIDKPVKVDFTARTFRDDAERTASLEGTVTLEGEGGEPLQLQSASVSVYDGQSAYTAAPLDCGAASAPGGGVTVPPKGAPPLVCKFAAKGLAPGGGVLLPTLVPAGGDAAKPLPAGAVGYSAEGAAEKAVGSCADLGTSMQLLQAGRAASWQPAMSKGALGGRACEGGTKTFSAWFGGDASGSPAAPACGDYAFDARATALPEGGDPVTGEARFAVKVEGCKRRRR